VIEELDRLFDLAFVRSPADSYIDCVSTNPDSSNIDVNLAREQHRQYVSILRECGVNVVEMPPLEAFPDSVFMQDPALLGRSHVIMGRFGEAKRRGEEKAFADELNNSNIAMGKVDYVSHPATLEGGDIVITEDGIFVGESSRTNSAGIKQLATYVSEQVVTAVKTILLHLLCGCSYLTDREIIIAPELLDTMSFPGFRFVTIPKEEAYACDALYVGNRKVMIPSGFPKAALKLKQAGYEPIEVEMSEFHKGDGGVTCLASPVYKLF
jgi:dimethylargininase